MNKKQEYILKEAFHYIALIFIILITLYIIGAWRPRLIIQNIFHIFKVLIVLGSVFVVSDLILHKLLKL